MALVTDSLKGLQESLSCFAASTHVSYWKHAFAAKVQSIRFGRGGSTEHESTPQAAT
jgi:hypothetical protein